MSQYNSVKNALNLLYYNSLNSSKIRKERGRDQASEHDITVKDLLNLWDLQDGKCYYTGIPMNYNSNEWRVSIERLNDDFGYIKTNIALICLELNIRSHWSKDKFINIIETVQKNIKINPISIEPIITQRKIYEKVILSKIDNIQYCNCNYCKQIKPITEFSKNIANGCRSCNIIRRHKYIQTFKGCLFKILNTSRLSTKIREAKNNPLRDTSHNIDFDFLVELFKKQHGLCAYSGLPLQFGSYLDKYWVVSIERINVFKGYIKDNVLLTCMEFNGIDLSIRLSSQETGNGGWTKEKFNYFLNHIKYKYGYIDREDFEENIQDFVHAKKYIYSPRPNIIRKYKSRIQVYNYPKFTDKQRTIIKDYNEVYIITSPSNKQFVGSCPITISSRGCSSLVKFIKQKMKQETKYKLLYEQAIKYIDQINEFKIEVLLCCKKTKTNKFEKIYIDQFKSELNNKEYKPKKNHTDETRHNISKTNIRNALRLSHDEKEILPTYMKAIVSWNDRGGYAIVSHPKCKKKDFVRKDLSFNEKYNLCLTHLRSLYDFDKVKKYQIYSHRLGDLIEEYKIKKIIKEDTNLKLITKDNEINIIDYQSLNYEVFDEILYVYQYKDVLSDAIIKKFKESKNKHITKI
jgi:hypothetical protein